ncbi:MAG TPA: hypothetical protein VII45_03920 [Solirubrobacterales bacterium]
MHPMRRIEAIKSEFDGEISPAAIRHAVREAEASTPIGAILSTLASEDFLPALIEAAEGRCAPEERAWLTLAAAGALKVRLALAWRATDLIDPEALVEVLLSHRDEIKAECERRADRCHSDEQQGGWLLLAFLRPSQLRRLISARPRLRMHWRQMREERSQPRRSTPVVPATRARRRKGRINPQIAGQFRALGLA